MGFRFIYDCSRSQFIISEKNSNDPYWYYERQTDRYKIAADSQATSILDGDIFQPIWYNWVFNYPQAFLGKQKTHDFYRKSIQTGSIQFPDLYIVFDAIDAWISGNPLNPFR